MGLALLAHAALLAALTWGVHWKRETRVDSAQAELWASVPQEAMPAAPPPPPPPPSPSVAPPAPALPKVQPVDPAIALERDKERKRKERQLAQQQEQEKREKQLQAQEKKQALAQQQAAEKKKLESDARREEANKQQKQETALLEKQRQAIIAQMVGQAGKAGTAVTGGSGSASQSAGPSASYAAKVVASVRRNITFQPPPGSNSPAVVEVRTAPDGTITASRLLKSSGSSAWDDAVLRALERTRSMPRDVDGRVPDPMELSFRPLE